MARILCVCEGASDLEALQSTLEADGHQVVVAEDSIHAVDQLVGGHIEAAILFLGLASRELWEVIPLLRRLDAKLPILTVAEEDTVETQREIRRSRVFYHLTQPIDTEELREALKGALADRTVR